MALSAEVKKVKSNIKFYSVMEYITVIIPLFSVIVAFIFYKEPLIFLGLIPATILALEFGNIKASEKKKLDELLKNQV